MGVFIKVTVQAFQDQGGVFMWAIMIVAGIGFGIVLERLYYLFIKTGIKGNKLYNEVLKHIENGDEEKAFQVLKGNNPIKNILRTILKYKDYGVDYVKRKVNIVFLTELPKINRNIMFLNVIANIATLLGLLGTIIGLIIAFDAVANVEAAKRAEALANGISIAMVTTAFGLIIAVPVLFTHGFLIAQSERIIEIMDEKSTKLINKIFK